MEKKRASLESSDDELVEEEEHRRQTRRRLLIIAVSSIVLAAATVGILVPLRDKNTSSSYSSSLSTKERQSITSICSVTLYKDFCFSSIYSLKQTTSNTSHSDLDTPKQIFMLSLQVAFNELLALESSVSLRRSQHSITQNALNACSRFIRDAMDHVSMSVASLQKEVAVDDDDVRTWLSTAITDQQTCLDGLKEFESISPSLKEEINASMANATIFTSNSLAIVSNIPAIVRGGEISARNLTGNLDIQYLNRQEDSTSQIRPNLTVAKDGSGDYETISEAVKAMPKRSKNRFFIYVKQGEYKENVVVDTNSWNLMMFGDGMEKTVVSSNLNHVDGVGTYYSATLIAEGRGFVAKDMGFKNTAGPKKYQAVAITSSSDQSIFYRCSIEAYQDTLFTHSSRQFYRECRIRGTIDFIFGNAASVFQNCTIQARQPMKGQYNTITAQSKSDPNQNTGLSIQRCSISALGNVTARTFFGRPWNVYSTTIVMETEVDGVVDPEGWTTWQPGIEAPDTIFYAEYKNEGPGSVVSGRVTWPGYRPDITDEEAQKFSVEEFIQGDGWLGKLNIGYDPHV